MSDSFFRIARVQLWPSASTKDVSLNGFGPACISAELDGMTDDQWLVSLVFDVRLAADSALLIKHAGDDRLWSSWIEAQCLIGRCRVVAQRSSATAVPSPMPETAAAPR